MPSVQARKLVAPFPYFGGKSRIAKEVWKRLGDTAHYSGAVLLARPTHGKYETVNDANGFLSNFWRAVKHDSDAVAKWCDFPVSERDLHARHYWLKTEGAERLMRIMGDPEGYDAQIAGWWVWGMCGAVGGAWLNQDGPWTWAGEEWRRGEGGIRRSIPNLAWGQGLNRMHLASGGDALRQELHGLAERLRTVRVTCGDWSRVVTEGPMHRYGDCSIFLDPPYGDGDDVFGQDLKKLAKDAAGWAISHGDDPSLRIAYCGYEGTVEFPGSWECMPWTQNARKAKGATQCRNGARERVWFSPYCLKVETADLFAQQEPANG